MILFINSGYSQTASVKFTDGSDNLVGEAELVDSWFLGLPAFTFNIKNLSKDTYFLAIYSGFGCKESEKGVYYHLENEKLIPWHTDKLLEFSTNSQSSYKGVLSLKPDKVTAETRELLTVEKMIGHPLILYNKKGGLEPP